jgi:hypothetical protein
MKRSLGRAALVIGALIAAGAAVVPAARAAMPGDLLVGDLLPTGQRLTPRAAPGALFGPLNPNLPGLPDYVAGQAVAMARSADGHWLAILTSGYNRLYTGKSEYDPALSNEYVFVYDIADPHHLDPPCRRRRR